MASEFGNALAKLARRLRIWQGDCEIGKVVAKLARLFAKLARLRISLASEIFTKLAKFYVRSEFRNVLCKFG